MFWRIRLEQEHSDGKCMMHKLNRYILEIFQNIAGVAMVEFAIIAPLFFVLFLGTIGWGFTMFLVHSMQFASEQSARCANIRGCLVNFNQPVTLNATWIPGLAASSFTTGTPPTSPTSISTIRTYTDTAGATRSYKVYCVQANVSNPFLGGYNWIPNSMKGFYCRPANIL